MAGRGYPPWGHVRRLLQYLGRLFFGGMDFRGNRHRKLSSGLAVRQTHTATHTHNLQRLQTATDPSSSSALSMVLHCLIPRHMRAEPRTIVQVEFTEGLSNVAIDNDKCCIPIPATLTRIRAQLRATPSSAKSCLMSAGALPCQPYRSLPILKRGLDVAF